MSLKRSRINQLKKMRSILRKRRRSKLKRKHRNFLKNKRKKEEKRSRSSYKNKVENIVINAGKSFSLFEDPENVILVIEQLETHKKVSKRIKNIQINLSGITKIDIGAISCLLAKVNEMTKITRVRIWGTIPQNLECKKVFDESGFLDYMTDLSGNKFTNKSDNFIFKVGSDKTRNERVGKTIEKAMKFITGKEEKYPPVYSIVQEICSNSVEWANAPETRNKNWFLGINKTTDVGNTYVTFTMTDIGYGILHTINKKFATLITEALFTKDTEVLKRAFEKKYGSKTKETNRNRGLPLIKDRYEKKYIKNLKVITNNVSFDFEQTELTKIINKNFPGTFYHWKVDLNCINKWNQIKEK